jgi:hypothetical protein
MSTLPAYEEAEDDFQTIKGQKILEDNPLFRLCKQDMSDF